LRLSCAEAVALVDGASVPNGRVELAVRAAVENQRHHLGGAEDVNAQQHDVVIARRDLLLDGVGG
jgi:hypothetical protein